MEPIFTDKDMSQMQQHGLDINSISSQIEDFKKGFGHLPVEKAATPSDGIIIPSQRESAHYIDLYESSRQRLRLVKFVPASGAATRMFKELFEYLSSEKMSKSIETLLAGIDKFAFREALDTGADSGDPRQVVASVIDYGAQLPKALILFHRYPDGARTAMAEHLAEAAAYASSEGKARLHFTISPEHEKGFSEQSRLAADYFSRKLGIKFEITFSQQDPATDTIAVNPDNTPFREADGSLLFRPAGHGALLGNLDAIDADIIFIKNIDNVTPDHLRGDTIYHKKMLAGMLIALQEQIFGHLRSLDGAPNEQNLSTIAKFVSEQLCCNLPDGFEAHTVSDRADFLRTILDRPLRVCAMVRNEGEPGGGPFWVRNSNGTLSLQIGEPSQIAPDQKHLLSQGTHFNPADLVCGVRNYRGEKFDLMRYSDPATGFISEKTKDGRPLKALELPGLWNGAMADWNTIFVETPVSTFTPVKEVNDLLRPQHQ